MFFQAKPGRKTAKIGLWAVISTGTIGVALPALAHHATAETMPTTWVEGFLSGLAHPVIGFDHLAFIVAVGLLGVTQGVILPVGFVLGTLAGTTLHHAGFDLPGVELGIASFLVIVGILLAQKQHLPWWLLVPGAAVAGVLHGYAYGEMIIGGQMTLLMAYLFGFTLIQLAIALGVWGLTRFLFLGRWGWSLEPLRSLGWMFLGIGLAFLVPQMVGLILPRPV